MIQSGTIANWTSVLIGISVISISYIAYYRRKKDSRKEIESNETDSSDVGVLNGGGNLFAKSFDILRRSGHGAFSSSENLNQIGGNEVAQDEEEEIQRLLKRRLRVLVHPLRGSREMIINDEDSQDDDEEADKRTLAALLSLQPSNLNTDEERRGDVSFGNHELSSPRGKLLRSGKANYHLYNIYYEDSKPPYDLRSSGNLSTGGDDLNSSSDSLITMTPSPSPPLRSSGYLDDEEENRSKSSFQTGKPDPVSDYFKYAKGLPGKLERRGTGYYSDNQEEISDQDRNLQESSSSELGLTANVDDQELTCDLNTRFQRVTEKIRQFTQDTPLQERIEANLNLLHLSQDFLFCAQTYGKIIISEVHLNVDDKTIKPISTTGVLGGEKFRVHDIMFKFAVDRSGLFGGDFAASKVAGHELKGLVGYFNCEVAELHVPLMCLVDYRGFRLIAISVLPIDHSSLIYGSCDAGKHIHSEDRAFNRLMRRAANKLNIKPHRVGSHVLYSPADLEGHLGKDGRYYLLDFSRTFPPEAPIRNCKNAHLSRLLRPEFVRNYPITSLCSDAFSGFIRGFHEEVNSEVIIATNHLLQVLIPKWSQGELLHLIKTSLQEGRGDSFRLTEAIHRVGINCRYLGLVRSHVPKSEKDCRYLILVEILARCIKNNMRLKLREKVKHLKKPLEEPYRRVVINYLNLVFGNCEDSDRYWNTHLKDDVKRNFCETLDGEEDSPTFPFKPRLDGQLDSNFLSVLLNRVAVITGTKFSTRVQNPDIFFHSSPFNNTDLLELPMKVKFSGIVHFSEGFYFHMKALTSRESDPVSAQRFYGMAIERFTEALARNPNNKEILLSIALTYTYFLEDEFKGQEFPSLSNPVVNQATGFYLQAISVEPKYDARSLFLYANFLDRCGKYDAAEDYYLQCLEADPNNSPCLIQYGKFLCGRGQIQIAQDFFKRAKGLKGNDWDYFGVGPKRSTDSFSIP